ncbi:MAG: HAD family phosphatase [Planctomycetota bacterium]|nr:MAG: HAD family phosphatase [Planctomycetota bacterium]
MAQNSSRYFPRNPPVHPQAFIFDLDGTLVDNMSVHQQAFDRFAERHGLPPISPELRRRLDGKRNRDIFPILFQRSLSEPEQRRFSVEKETLYRQLSVGRLAPMAGLEELLQALKKKGLPSAIATSAPAPNVPHTLAEIGLPEAFPLVVRGDQVPRGKPHPDIFLEAARQLGASPSHCLAFEDALMGLEAAKAAGMPCIAMTTSQEREVWLDHGQADFVARDFHDFLAGPGAWLRD